MVNLFLGLSGGSSGFSLDVPICRLGSVGVLCFMDLTVSNALVILHQEDSSLHVAVVKCNLGEERASGHSSACG